MNFLVDNIASFEETRYIRTRFTSSRCSAIVYRGYVHGIAIRTKAEIRISTRFCQFYFVLVIAKPPFGSPCDSGSLSTGYITKCCSCWNFSRQLHCRFSFSIASSLDFKISWLLLTLIKRSNFYVWLIRFQRTIIIISWWS